MALAACASTLHVHTRALPSASFQHYRTFGIGSSEDAPAGYRRLPVTAEVLALVDAVAREKLTALGYHGVPAATEADLVVRVGAGLRNKPPAPAADQDALGNETSNDDMLDGAFTYTEETLSIDVFDTKTNRRVWHGASREIIKPDRVNRGLVDSAARAILAHFPKSATPG